MRILNSFIAISFLASCVFGAELSTKEQKEAYSLGASTGGYLLKQINNHKALGVQTDTDIVIQGFLDAIKNQTKLTNDQVITLLNDRAEALNKAAQDLQKAELAKNKKESKEFLEKNAKNSKVKTTKSGLQYEILKDAKGDKPKPESIVLVNYKAYLPNGDVFEDTYKAGKASHLSLINIIEGLSEGLRLMSVGSKYKFVIPSELAYGDNGVEVIPGGSAVVFETELLKIFKPGELVEEAKKMSAEEVKSFHGVK
ncbi:FKBP-type peptidyl-prolyl cis-trans isomerase N-terminal domain-containing protein [Campylobacter sp. 9BO]|uniref:FKBP-type peptidyl-prolyl cis-trans isomerase N-terminal domain-containing protein n=1 Tax=Campylobacter sp. 9BO TaxID=3424759 RepID=UPI003D327DE3